MRSPQLILMKEREGEREREQKNSFMNDACASAGDKNLINVNLKKKCWLECGLHIRKKAFRG